MSKKVLKGNKEREYIETSDVNTLHSVNSYCNDSYTALNHLLSLHYKALSGKYCYVKPPFKQDEKQNIHPIEPKKNISQIHLAKASYARRSLNLKGMYSKFVTLCTPKSPAGRWKRQDYLKCVKKHQSLKMVKKYNKRENDVKKKCPVPELSKDTNKSCKETNKVKKSYEYDVTNKLTEEYYIRLLSPSEISLFEECLMRSELTDEHLLSLVKKMLNEDGVIDQIIDTPVIKDFIRSYSNEQLASLLIEKLGSCSLLPDKYLGSFGKYVKQRLADIFHRVETSLISEKDTDSLWNIANTQETNLQYSKIKIKNPCPSNINSGSSESLVEKHLRGMNNYPEILDEFGCRLGTYSFLSKKESVSTMLKRLHKYEHDNSRYKCSDVHNTVVGAEQNKKVHSIQLDKCKTKKYEEIFEELISMPKSKEHLNWDAMLSDLQKLDIKEILDEKFGEVQSADNVKPPRKNESKYNLVNELVDKISKSCDVNNFMEDNTEKNNSLKDKKSRICQDGRLSFKNFDFDNFLRFHKFLQNEEVVPLHSYEKKLNLKPVIIGDSGGETLLDSIIGELEETFLELDATKYGQDWDDLLSSVGSGDTDDVEDVYSTNGSEDHLVLDLDEYKTEDPMENTNNEEIIESDSNEESMTLDSADLQDVEDLFKKEDFDWLPYNIFDDPEFVIHKDEETSSSSTSYDSVFSFPSCDSDNKDKKMQELSEINDSDDTTTTESDSTPHGPEESSTDPEDEWIPKGMKYDPTVKKAMQDKIWKLDEDQIRKAEEYLENMKRKGQVKNKEEDEMTQALPWEPYIGVTDERGKNAYNDINETPASLKDKYGEQLIQDLEKIYETYDSYDTACRSVPLQVLKNIHALSELKGEDAIIARYAMHLCMTNDLEKLDEIFGKDLKVYAPAVKLVKNLLESLHHPNFLFDDVLLKIPPPPHKEKVQKILSDASLIPYIRKLGTDRKGLKKRMKLSLRLMKRDDNKTIEDDDSIIGGKLHEKKKQTSKDSKKTIDLKLTNKLERPKKWEEILGAKKKTCNDYMFSKNYENEKFSDPEEWSWSEGDSEILLTDNFKENIIQCIEEEFTFEGKEFLDLLEIDIREKKSEPSTLCFDGKMNVAKNDKKISAYQIKCPSHAKKIKKSKILQLDGGGKNETENENDWNHIYKEVGVFNNANRMEFLRYAYPENYEYLIEKAKRGDNPENYKAKQKALFDAKHDVLPVVPLHLKKKERIKRLSKVMGLVVKDSEMKTHTTKNNYPFGSRTHRGLEPIKRERPKIITPVIDVSKKEEFQDYLEEDYPRTEETERFFYQLMTFYNPEKALKYLRNKTGEQKTIKDIMEDLNDGLAKKNHFWFKKYCKLLEEQSFKPTKSCDAEVKQNYFPWKTKDVSPVIPGTNVQISEPQIKDLYEVEDAWGYSLPPLDFRSCGLSPDALDSVLSRMLDQDIKAVELAGIDLEKEFKNLQAQIERGLFKTPTHYALQTGRLNVPKERTYIPAPWHYGVQRWPETLKQSNSVINKPKQENKHIETTLRMKKQKKPIKMKLELNKGVQKIMAKGFKKTVGAIYKRLTDEKVFCLFCTFPVKPNYHYIIGNYAICYECFKAEQVPLEDYMEKRGLYNVKAVRPGYKKVKPIRTSRVEIAKPLKDVHDYKWKRELFINRFVNSYYFGGFIPDISVFKASKNNKIYKKYKDFKIMKRENTQGEIIKYYKENLVNLKKNKECPSVLPQSSFKHHEPGAGIKLWRNSSTKPI